MGYIAEPYTDPKVHIKPIKTKEELEIERMAKLKSRIRKVFGFLTIEDLAFYTGTREQTIYTHDYERAHSTHLMATHGPQAKVVELLEDLSLALDHGTYQEILHAYYALKSLLGL